MHNQDNWVYSSYEGLKGTNDDPSAIYSYLSLNNKQVKQNILEHLLNFQKLAIKFENEARLQNVDREMWNILESKHESQLKNLEIQIRESKNKFEHAHNEILKLKSENYTYKNELLTVKYELEKIKSSFENKNEHVSSSKISSSINPQNSDSNSFMSVGASSKMFKFKPSDKEELSAKKSATRYNSSTQESVEINSSNR